MRWTRLGEQWTGSATLTQGHGLNRPGSCVPHTKYYTGVLPAERISRCAELRRRSQTFETAENALPHPPIFWVTSAAAIRTYEPMAPNAPISICGTPPAMDRAAIGLPYSSRMADATQRSPSAFFSLSTAKRRRRVSEMLSDKSFRAGICPQAEFRIWLISACGREAITDCPSAVAVIGDWAPGRASPGGTFRPGN